MDGRIQRPSDSFPKPIRGIEDAARLQNPQAESPILVDRQLAELADSSVNRDALKEHAVCTFAVSIFWPQQSRLFVMIAGRKRKIP